MLRQHRPWVERLRQEYSRLPGDILPALAPRYALEDEIARLIDDAARRVAQQLIDDWERPAESNDLFDRAVAGHWRALRERVRAESIATAQQFRSDL